MRKIYIILAMTIAALPGAVFAQAEYHHRGDTLGVTASGRELITITQNEGSNFQINIGGFSIDLDGGQRYRERSHHDYVLHQHYVRRKRARNFSIGGFQLGFTGLTKPDYSMYGDDMWKFLDLNNGKSISFAFEASVNFALSYSNRTWISVGIRPRWNNYVFSEKMTIVKHEGMINPIMLDEMKRFKKSKLSTFSLDVPVLFEFRPARRLSITAGGYVGMTLGDHTKVKFRKDKDKGDFGMNFLNAGLIVRLQYRNIGIFADYSLTPLFKDEVGPKTQPFTIGIILW